ncbi:MAG: hypothetical protein REI78_14645 [Pedobacter sp.]|nr:hypothetical protein [Pedobacter sp.]MDQ8054268.1 hypothetical protein [Pedobacter sp.]
MKFCILVFCLLSSTVLSKAQQDTVLPIDEQGKLIYYELVHTDQVSKDSLKNRAVRFLNKKDTGLKLKSVLGDTATEASGKFVISKTLLVMSHPSGEVLYQFHVEYKEGKYRFWMTNFLFIPYQRDRYGNFVAASSVGMPLENMPGKLNASQWKEYQVQATASAKQMAQKFKLAMENQVQPTTVPAATKIVKKSW